MTLGMEDERLLPIANVGRIMKQIVPARAKISKEGKQVMQECATEFISFVTGEASDKCHKENRKTVNGDDICWALSALGFDNYADAIARYLHKYRQAERDKASQQCNNKAHKPQSQSKFKFEDSLATKSSSKTQEEETDHQVCGVTVRESRVSDEKAPASQSS